MTNVTLSNTAIKTTVCITWTDAPIVRIIANVDMPEYDVKARQTIYLVKSNSLNEGHEGEGTLYRIIVWGDRKATGWSCNCKGFETYRRCHHVQKANQHSRNRAKRIAIQKVAQDQVKKQRWVKYNLSSFFEAMYCIALEQVVRPEPVMQIMAVNKEVASPVKVTLKPHRYCTNCTCALPLQMVNGQHVCVVCAGHTREKAPLQGGNFKVINGVPMR